jgi:hypothetical protein
VAAAPAEPEQGRALRRGRGARTLSEGFVINGECESSARRKGSVRHSFCPAWTFGRFSTHMNIHCTSSYNNCEAFSSRDNRKHMCPVPCAPPNRSKFSRIMSARCAPPALATLKTPFLDNSLSRALEAVLLTSNALFARVRPRVFF